MGRVEQSPEGYKKMVQGVETGKKQDKHYDFIEENPDNDIMFKGPGKLLGRLERKLSDALGLGAKGAEERLQKYMDEGHAEGVELNQTFEQLKLDVLQAQADFQEYTEAHKDVVDENTPGYQQLNQRIEDAIGALETFKTEKLGMSPAEEQAEAA